MQHSLSGSVTDSDGEALQDDGEVLKDDDTGVVCTLSSAVI